MGQPVKSINASKVWADRKNLLAPSLVSVVGLQYEHYYDS